MIRFPFVTGLIARFVIYMTDIKNTLAIFLFLASHVLEFRLHVIPMARFRILGGENGDQTKKTR